MCEQAPSPSKERQQDARLILRGNNVSCAGHIGHIKLADPVIHIEYIDTLIKI